MLNFPIIIYGNSTTANINTSPYITIADIGEMWELGTFPNIRVFNLYESYLHEPCCLKLYLDANGHMDLHLHRLLLHSHDHK